MMLVRRRWWCRAPRQEGTDEAVSGSDRDAEVSTVPGIRCMMMRGGTSKGLYFLAADLPAQPRAAGRAAAADHGQRSPAADRRARRCAFTQFQSGHRLAVAPRRRRHRLPVPAVRGGPGDRHRPAELRKHPGRGGPVRGRARLDRAGRRHHDDAHPDGQLGQRGHRDVRHAGRRAGLHGRHRDRRGAGHRRPDQLAVCRHGRLGDRAAAAHRPRLRCARRRPGQLRGQRHAGGRGPGRRPGHHRLRIARRAGR